MSQRVRESESELPPVAPAASRPPLLGRTLEHRPLECIQTEYLLDLEEDLFLADHCLLGSADLEPASARVPILPLTMGLELMAQAAAGLAPGLGLIGFENAVASRWIALADRDRLALEVTGTRIPDSEDGSAAVVVDVAVRTPGERPPAMTGRVLFGEQYQGAPQPVAPLAGVRNYGSSAARIYAERRLFHGPSFQCLAGEPKVATHGIVGEIEVPSQGSLFRSERAPRFLCHPVVLDGVGQLVGIWAMSRGETCFPVGLEGLEFFGPSPAEGTRLNVRVEVTGSEWKLHRARVEILDGSGRIWARIAEWRQWAFKWPERVLDFRRRPKRHLVSERVDLPPALAGVSCRLVSQAELADDTFDLTARLTLTADEMAQYRALSSESDRSVPWLAERIAAKDVVRSWLRGDQDGEMACPTFFELDARRRDDLPKGLSVASSGRWSAAAAHGQAIGIAIVDSQGSEEDAAVLSAVEEASRRLAGPDGTPRGKRLEVAFSGSNSFDVASGSGRKRILAHVVRHEGTRVALAVWDFDGDEARTVSLDHVAY